MSAMQVCVRFTAQGSNSAFGNFAAGDLLRCAPDLARHLVEEAGVAEYVAPAQPPEKAAAPAAAPKAGRKRSQGGTP